MTALKRRRDPTPVALPTLSERSDWLRRRSALLHDWLSAKNYLGKVQLLPRILAGEVERPDYTIARVSSLLAEWTEREAELASLADDALHALSPAVAIERSPLARMRSSERYFVGEAVHLLWLHRMADVAEEISDALSKCRASAEKLQRSISRLPADGVVARYGRILAEANRYSFAVRQLHAALSKLPTRVQIT